MEARKHPGIQSDISGRDGAEGPIRTAGRVVAERILA